VPVALIDARVQRRAQADHVRRGGAFGQSLGSAGYSLAFDDDADGIVNNGDLFHFRSRFGQSVDY
jgi:hypothetical protein